MKMKVKQIIGAVLVLCLCLSLLPNEVMLAEAASTGLSLSQLRQKFPHGKYWNGRNADSYTSSPCNHHGSCSYNGSCGCNSFLGLSIQCMGYAEKLGYDATGYNPRNNANGWYTYTSSSALDNLKPGDIVRYKNNGHSIYVTGVNGDTVTYTDCNSDGHCIIRWDVTISKSTLRSSFTHVRSAPSSVSPGSTSCSCSTSYAGTYICTTSSLNLTIRSGHGSSYSAIGSIPPGATVTVSKASGTSSSDWAHVTYNGVTGYASMQYLSKKQATQQRDSRIGLWLSDSEMGGSISTIRTGEWLYLCYKLYDANTGDLLDTYNTSGGYTAKLTLYETNGAVAHTYTYTNDNNWISIKRTTPGNYKGELVFKWNSGGTTTSTVSINMVYEPRVTPSASDIQLNVTGTNSQTISISYSGATSSNSIYLDCTTTGDCFSYKWGSWSDHKMPLTITGVRAGQGVITIEMYDSDTDQIIATSKVYVTVTAPAYTVSYNANGGSGAPSSQTKYYNTTLTLSSTKPTRTGYTFLGWATSSTATSATYQPGSSFIINDDTTLYAVWKKGCEGGKHKYTYDVTGTPTTTRTGKIVGECGYCGATTSVLLPMLNTNDYTYKIAKAATCTTTGTGRYTWKTTTYGSFYFDVSISTKGHTYTNKVIAPTCTTQGYIAHICSVCGNSYTDSYTASLGHSWSTWEIVVVPSCTTEGTAERICSICGKVETKLIDALPGEVVQWNVSLQSDFRAKFHIQINPDMEKTASISITVGGETSTCKVSQLSKQANGYYILYANVAAAQMNDNISIQVHNEDVFGGIFTYNVRQYCNTLLADSSQSKYHPLVKEMLNYGAMAQKYFDHGTDDLANSGITGAGATAVPGSAQQLQLTDNISGLDFYGASLVFRDRIAVRYYFAGDVSGCTFTANGKTYTPVAKDGMYYIEIADILPQDLEQQITLTVADASGKTLSVSYSPMNYIVRMNEKGSAELKALVKALYNYHLAAKALA